MDFEIMADEMIAVSLMIYEQVAPWKIIFHF